MGHERGGGFPKSRRWKSLVRQITQFSGVEGEAQTIATNTLENVRSRFAPIQNDAGVKEAFKFLVALSVSSKSQPPETELRQGLTVPLDRAPLMLAKELQKWLDKNHESPEYARLAQCAANDAITLWYSQRTREGALFPSTNEQLEVWRAASTGSGFCELARLFFAKFTERYLNYFLAREASSLCNSVRQRDLLEHQIREHISALSKHAFETAKITQSFAAGWFNKNTKEGFPSDEEITGFLTIAFGKIREELRREQSETSP